MSVNRSALRRWLREGEFTELFIDGLGWDRGGAPLRAIVNEFQYELTPAATKRGLTAYICSPGPDGQLPPRDARRKIQRQVAKQVHEHLIVFVDEELKTQVWQWVKREIGKPLAVREHFLHSTHQGEALAQKLEGLAVSLDEEESLTIVDVAQRVRLAFDVEQPTRRFYDRFQSEHRCFLDFISGITDKGDREWYASVMLSRLMFVYFIQKKGLLDNNKDYLRDRLKRVRAIYGDNHFHSFYRFFLLRLFYEGLGQQEERRPKDLEALIGRVPYLNGGMFVPHQLEETYEGIQIPDEAFEKVLNFFDEFDWHLDDRPVGNDNEINPEVLGYIFERHINQKQMGAYYTKEDVTEYIARSAIIPRLLDRVQAILPSAFVGPGSVWQLLQADPERYIMPSVCVGVEKPFPSETSPGVLEAVGETPLDRELGLPRETWPAVIDRRHHHRSVLEALRAGRVGSTDDLVTWNIDVRQFAQDIIDYSDSPELLHAFYRVLISITILDPTCGSGAFLFAAMNILEPLYEAVLDRMATYVSEAERVGWPWNKGLKEEFTRILSDVSQHRNRKYVVYRTIAVNNLFGVDLMEEAAEICKLRLFLKLASQVEDYGDVEPLPDIDFNIRAGNALVGYTQRPGSPTGELDLSALWERLERQTAEVDELFREYRSLQTTTVRSGQLREKKRALIERLRYLDAFLNRSLAANYDIFSDGKRYEGWRKTHAPFHWWANFYAQMVAGGFDVIIGNPPYIQSKKVRQQYTVKGLATEGAPDIYAWILERVTELVVPNGRTGMIVPLSLSFSSKFDSLRRLLHERYEVSWYSHFGRIPSALFNYDVRVRNTIHIGRRATGSVGERKQYTTRLHRWFEEERPYLLELLRYVEYDPNAWAHRIPKTHTSDLLRMLEIDLVRGIGPLDRATSDRPTQHVLYFKKSAYNWLNFCRVLPPCFDATGSPIPHTEFGMIYFADAETRDLAFLFLNGKWAFAFWYLIGDDFHVTRWMFGDIPVNLHAVPADARRKLLAMVPVLEAAMAQATSFKLNARKRVGNYNLARCRHITDQTDAIFAEAFGWTTVWPDVDLLYNQAIKTAFDDGEDG